MGGSVGASRRSTGRFGDDEAEVIAAIRRQHVLGLKNIVVVFDILDPEAEKRMYREQAGWRSFADVMPLGYGYAALVIWPGGTRGLLR